MNKIGNLKAKILHCRTRKTHIIDSPTCTDWYVCTIAFIVIPHILKSLFTLLSQKWPKIGLKDLKTLGQCSKIKNILFVPLWNFEWKAIFEALPLVHIVKRCISFYSLIISPERLHDFWTIHTLPHCSKLKMRGKN